MIETAHLLPTPAYKVELVEKNNTHYYRVDGKDTLLPGYSTIFRKVVAKPALMKWAGDLSAKSAAAAAKAEVQQSLAAGKWSRSLDEAALAWEQEGAKAPNAKRDKAADVGTGLHGDLEAFFRDGVMSTRERTAQDEKALANFLAFWETSGFRFVASEICVAIPPPSDAEEMMMAPCAPYGGKLDLLVADKAGDIMMADIKTGNVVDHRSGVPYPDVWVQEAAYKVAAEETYPGLKIAGLLMFHVRHDVPAERILHKCKKMATAEKAWLGVRGLYDNLKLLEVSEPE